jgi:ATP-dependent DNA ligase
MYACIIPIQIHHPHPRRSVSAAGVLACGPHAKPAGAWAGSGDMNIDQFRYFYPEKPCLMQIETPLFESLSHDQAWIAEPKYNGSRLQLHFVEDSWQFWNRNGAIMAYTPNQEMRDALNDLNLKGYWLFDGELRHNKVRGVRHKIVIYDLFVCDGHLMLGVPFSERRRILDFLFHYRAPDSDALDIIFQYDQHFQRVFDSFSDDPEIEGLILKKLDSQLNLGENRACESLWMYKIRKPSLLYNF